MSPIQKQHWITVSVIAALFLAGSLMTLSAGYLGWIVFCAIVQAVTR